MAAAPYRHRKLLEYPPANGTTTFPVCPIQCNPFENPTAVCSFECIPFCPTFCHLAPYSPTPSPATTPYTTLTPLDHHHHQPPLSLPLKISLFFLIATFIYTLYKFYTVWWRSRRHRGRGNQQTHNQNQNENNNNNDTDVVEIDHPIWYIRTMGLQQSVINGLAVVKFSKVDGTVVEGTFCSVCLTEFEQGDTLRLLPNCKHAFHVSCIDTWLRSHINCPLCRAVIVNNSVHERSSEQNDGDSVDREINLGVLTIGDGDGDQGEASGSSGLRIGERETDEEVRNDNSVK